MDDFIPGAVRGLKEFLSKNQANFKRLPKSALISCLTPVNFDFERININEVRKNFELSFYFEKPSEKIKFLSLDHILSIEESGQGRFAATEKKINTIKNNYFSNWDNDSNYFIPLFIGAMKFTVEHSDDNWKDFNDSTWFVPEILLIEKENKSYLLYNFLLNSGNSSIIEKFENKLLSFESNCCKNLSRSVSYIRQINGNEPKYKKKWKNSVTEALNEIESLNLNKVVLSRKLEIILSGEPDFVDVINKFRKDFNDCYNFVYNHNNSSFFGATPERLVKLFNNKIELDALAGSAPRGNTEIEDKKIENELLKNEKNKSEHQFVVEYLKNSVQPYAEKVEEKNRLSVKKLNNIQHLQTKIFAELKNQNSIFRLLDDVFPTPAICGVPKETALVLIKKIEQHNRGLYSGILGWFNFINNGEFVVAIRSAVNYKNKVIAFAGGGIVRDSNPDEEFSETELKFKPILSLFSNENK